MKQIFRYTGWFFGALILLLAGPIMLAANGTQPERNSWQTASRDSAGLAPPAAEVHEAIVQVYGARAWSWRGYFAVHTWVATKEEGADHYKVHEVTGWRRHVVNSRPEDPDRHWYGAKPEIDAEMRGEDAQAMIRDIYKAGASYPYASEYDAWPGPNSNSVVAWVIRETPELNVALPNHAIGKDYLGSRIGASTPGGAGYQPPLGGDFRGGAGARGGLDVYMLGPAIRNHP